MHITDKSLITGRPWIPSTTPEYDSYYDKMIGEIDQCCRLNGDRCEVRTECIALYETYLIDGHRGSCIKTSKEFYNKWVKEFREIQPLLAV